MLPANPSLPVILVVEHVRSAHNVGAIFRTADATGIERILFSSLSATPPRTEISKTALGAEETVSWQQRKDLPAALVELKQQGYTICALEQTPLAQPLFTTDLPFPLVLIVGHEREGVSQELLSLCDFHVELPMQGQSAHSLNVSVACGIALYELGRRVWYHTGIQ